MIDMSYLDKALVICPTAFKNAVLKKATEKKQLLKSKFMSLEVFLKNYFFDYDFKAIKHLTEKYEMKIDVAKMYLDNLYFIKDQKYGNEKLDALVEYKRELMDNNLLIKNKYFLKYLETFQKIIVVGYGQIDRFYQSVFENLNAEIIGFDFKEKEYNYVEFKTMEEEVGHLYNSIAKLLEDDVDINDVYILNAGSNYDSYINRYNNYFHFKVEEKNESSLSSLTIVKDFIDVLKEKDQEKVANFLEENKNSNYIDKIVSIINKYIDLDEYIDLIIYELNNSKIKNESYIDVVKRVNAFEPFEDDDYVFVVGFNDSFPPLSVDTDYITDNIKDLVGLSSTEENNNLKKENLLNYLSNINNLYLSYCENSLMDNFNKSVLLDYMTTNSKANNSYSYNYSDKLNRYRFSKQLDQFSKYNIKNQDLEKLYATYQKNDYQQYDHSYKKITKQLDSSVTLSYSQINNYYKCPFKYFVEKKLKINDETTQFYMQLGNIFHEVLKEVFEKDISDEAVINKIIDEKINKIITELNYTETEKHFTISLKQQLLKDIEIIREQHQLIAFENYEYEIEKVIPITKDISFKGIIDKLIHQKVEDERLIALVDYKTGYETFKEELVPDGLSLQLPCYLYLASKMFEKEEKKYVGFYIQHLINTDNKYEKNKDIDFKKVNSMKLKGKSNGDHQHRLLIEFDKTYDKSQFINITITKEGKIRFNAGIDDAGIEELIKLTEEKIKNAGKAILNRDFPITPYEYKESCKYCTYSDICYRRSSDFKKIKEMEDEDE